MSEAFKVNPVCATCGKEFFMLYPDLWVYKRQSKTFCSWRCLRAYDEKMKGEDKTNMAKLSERSREAVNVALAGGDPKKYLEDHGSKNPGAAWYSITHQLKEEEPETYQKLKSPKTFTEGEEVAHQVEHPEAHTTLIDADDESITVETIRKPLAYDGMTVTAVMGKYGRYSLDSMTTRGKTYLDYTSQDGDELSMTVEQWRAFLAELKHAGEILGVEL